jgi:hypothetical protein
VDARLIQFHAKEKDRFPAPYPAAKAIPDWFKLMPTEAPPRDPGTDGRPTVKQCPPFADALACGYVIPLSGDLIFTLDASGKFVCECPNGDATMAMHASEQLIGSPLGRPLIVKFLNPWTIVTPPGYSTLVVEPLNRAALPFHFFAGVVDTDRLYKPINFPASCLMEPGSRCALKRGTPLVQVIPFRRDDWRSELEEVDLARVAEVRQQIAADPHHYREHLHHKKVFR